MVEDAKLQILVINLESEVSRRLQCSNQLQDLKHEFVSAIDGRGMPRISGQLVTAPVEAIWLSHLKALNTFLNSEYEHCLILEDDFDIASLKDLRKILQLVENCQFDLVQLGWLSTGFDVWLLKNYEGFTYFAFRALNFLSRFNSKIRQLVDGKLRPERASEVPSFAIPDSFLPGAHAYMVSRNFAKAVVRLNSPTFLAADDFYMAIVKMRAFNTFRLRKSVVSQKGLSTIGSNRFTRIQNQES
jgi:GR25 family glycosyltransferase involved in LPS biosynthesis